MHRDWGKKTARPGERWKAIQEPHEALCWWDLVWFRGSFLCNPKEHMKRSSGTTRPLPRFTIHDSRLTIH